MYFIVFDVFCVFKVPFLARIDKNNLSILGICAANFKHKKRTFV
jgi:hypothetical protein